MSETKPIFKERLERLDATIDELSRPEWYHVNPQNLGFMNGLILAAGILRGRDPRNISFLPPPQEWLEGKEKKKEIIT